LPIPLILTRFAQTKEERSTSYNMLKTVFDKGI